MRVQALQYDESGNWCSLDGDGPIDPALVLVFGPSDTLKTSSAPARLAEQFPSAVHVGCSTGTTVDGVKLADDRLTAAAIAFDRTQVRLASRKLYDPSCSREVGHALGQDLAGPDLTTVFVLSEGLGVNGSALVEGLIAGCGERVTVSGGLAGDGARFAETLVMIGGKSSAGTVAAIGFYGSAIRVGHGKAGGWDEFGPVRRISQSNGNVLSELDGKPALDLYERYLGEEAAGLPASALFYPLKIWDPAFPDNHVVRTVLAVDRDARTMTFAGDVPVGWNARLMRGSFDRLTEGAAEAARQALDDLGSADSPSLCLLVSCVGRRLLMGQRTEEEVEAVARIIGDKAAIAGFYSYGEIAPSNSSGTCGLHNQTVTLTLLSEAA